MRLLTFSFLALVVALASCKPAADQSSSQQTTTPDTTIIKTAEAAFVFAMPLALMDISRKGGPGNQMVHFTKFPDANFRDVVRPNADTYYNTASLDLSSDAMVLEVPNTNGRYYLLPMLDAWTNIFISPGKRTTGTEAQKYLKKGPQRKATEPAGLEEIKANTRLRL